MNIKNKVAIITGASSGIGRELALQMAHQGSKVVLAARRASLLEDLAQQITQAGHECLVVPTDVSQRSQVEALMQKAFNRFGAIHILINNAGVSLAQGPLMENREEDVRQTMEINLMGGIYGVWAAVPLMEKGGGGQIVFVSSVLGKRGVSRNAVYSASKFAIQGLTEGLRIELKSKNIHVLTVCPPGVDTPFFTNNHKADVRTYRLHSVEKIAAMIIKGIEKEKREMVMTMDGKLLYYGNVFFPKLMDWGVLKVKGD